MLTVGLTTVISKLPSTEPVHVGGAAPVGVISAVTPWGIGFARATAAKARTAIEYCILIVLEVDWRIDGFVDLMFEGILKYLFANMLFKWKRVLGRQTTTIIVFERKRMERIPNK